MAKPVLNAPQFQSEPAAFAYVEARLWPNGPVCPHCQNADQKRIGRLNGKTTRPGLHKCYACKKPFTVRMGTLFEDSHLPLHLWLQVIHLFCCSKKGIATRQIQRMLNCSMKTAWFLGHRIRLAMDPGYSWPDGRRWQDGRSRRYRNGPLAQDPPPPAQRTQRQGSQPCRTWRPDPLHGHRPSRYRRPVLQSV